MTNLTKRQSYLVNELSQFKFETVADVGCDHGYVGFALKKLGIAKKVLFCDISAPSLEKAKNLCKDEPNCEFYVQDGLGTLFCDCCVIAGMGGREIMSILAQAQTLPEWLLLQPMKNVKELRNFLCRNYRLQKDVLIIDKKFYNVILCQRGNDVLTELEQKFGRDNLKNPSDDFCRYVNIQIDKFEKIVQNTTDSEVQKELSDLYFCKKEIENAKRNI